MNNKTELFETMPLNKAIMKLVIPTIISSLVMVIYNLADTYFVGLMNDPVQTSAVTLAATVMLAFNAVNNLFGVGGSSMISRSLGSKNMKAVHQSSAFSFYGALICAIFFAIGCTVFKTPLMNLLGATEETWQATSEYMLWTVTFGAIPAILNVVLGYMVRSEGAAFHASMGTMSGCILNMILDPIFILPFGLNMKAAGAGLATFISNCFACAYFFFYLYRKRGETVLSLSIKDFTLEKSISLGVCGVGIPASIQNLLNVVSMTIFNNFAAVYGATALAAMGIVKKIDNIPFMIALGGTQGVMPLISYNYASGNSQRMKDAIMKTLKMGLAFVLLMTGVYYFFAGNLVGAFMNNEEVIAYGTAFLRGMCLALSFIMIDFTAVSVFQAIGKGQYSLLFAILRKVVFEIPALIILNHFFPLYGLAYGQVVSEFILAIAAIIMLRKIFISLKKA